MKVFLKGLNFIFLFLSITVLNAQNIPEMPIHGICAHRGAMDTHPENTISAFKEAVRLGVQMIELDVQLTSDNHLVVLHDNTVDRTTNGQGEISDFNLEQARLLDAGSWKSPEFKGERIPSLREALSAIPGNIWINVHLKGGAEMGEKVARVLVDEKKTHQAFLACEIKASAAAKNVDPDILICNMDRQDSMDEYVKLTLDLKSDFIQLYKVEVDGKIKGFTSKLKAEEIGVNYCCTDSPEELKKLFDYGVDFVLVNQVARMMNAADSLNLIPSLR